MTPALFFGIIPIIFGILAALNYFYFNNIPFFTIFSVLTVILFLLVLRHLPSFMMMAKGPWPNSG